MDHFFGYVVFNGFRTFYSLKVLASIETMGYFVPASVYCNLILQEMKELGSVGHYQVLATLLSTSPKNEVVSRIDDLTETLSSTAVCGVQDVS